MNFYQKVNLDYRAFKDHPDRQSRAKRVCQAFPAKWDATVSRACPAKKAKSACPVYLACEDLPARTHHPAFRATSANPDPPELLAFPAETDRLVVRAWMVCPAWRDSRATWACKGRLVTRAKRVTEVSTACPAYQDSLELRGIAVSTVCQESLARPVRRARKACLVCLAQSVPLELPDLRVIAASLGSRDCKARKEMLVYRVSSNS